MNPNSDSENQWFVMRDLKRHNAKVTTYQQLSELGLEVFVPTEIILTKEKGKSIKKEIRCMANTIFVKTNREVMDPIVQRTPTLQYRFDRGGYCRPMVVPTKEMDRFITAIQQNLSCRYYLPEEITPKMIGKRVRILSGPLSGFEGNLLTVRGSHCKRLLVELPHLLSAAIEITGEYIEFIS